MTGILLWKADGCSYVATDGAAFDPSGTVIALGSKCSVANDLRIAFAYSGRGGHYELMPELGRILPNGGTQSQFLEAIPKALRRVRKRLKREWPETEHRSLNEIVVHIAAHTDKGPKLFIVPSTVQMPDGQPPLKAYQLNEVEGHIAPAVDAYSLLGRTYIENPTQDGRILFEAMRGQTFENLSDQQAVGGECVYHEVSPFGVSEARQIISWPDEVGKTISR